jgi:hypothetical protein
MYFVDKAALRLAAQAGIDPFEPILAHRTSKGLIEHARLTLGDRSAYFSEGSQRMFSAKVHELDLFASRFVMGVVESVDMGDSHRIYRAVLIRADGMVIYRTPDDVKESRHSAGVAMRNRGVSYNPRKVLEDAICDQLKERRRQVADLELALSNLPLLPPP